MVVENKETQNQSEKFTIKVDGQVVEVTRDELIELAQQGKDYTKKTQALSKREEALNADAARVAGLKSIVDEMEADPKLKETLNKVYSDFKSGKIAKSDTTKDSSLKLLDKRIDEASDSATREQLKEIREIIKQEAPVEEVSSLKNELKLLREEIALVKNAAILGQTDRVEIQLQKLEEKFGADLVSKYKPDIKAMALKFPNQTVSKLLYHFAEDTELETALLNQGKKKEKEEVDRKRKGSSPGADEGSFVAKTALEKDKRTGRVTFNSIKQRVLERLGRA